VKTVFYILLLLFAPLSFALGQKRDSVALPVAIGFADSLRMVMENTRSVDASVVGGGLTVAWGNMTLDVQQRIQKQTYLMKRKGYKLRPQLVQYFGAIVNAVNVEGIDPTQFNNFLTVVDKVIANYTPGKAVIFFKNSREFFEHHTLYFDKGYRLYAANAEYTFKYLEFIPPPPDTLASLNETVTDTWTEEPVDTVYHEPPPYWETPAPQPVLDGAVITFTRTDLNFVTKYDSVFLKNTKGSFSLTDYLFVGEEGASTGHRHC
jgi:hypothetical protein